MFFCLVLLCFRARLFIAAFWSPAGKGLTSWLSFVMSNFSIGILGQVLCLIVSISYLYPVSYYEVWISFNCIQVPVLFRKQVYCFKHIFCILCT